MLVVINLMITCSRVSLTNWRIRSGSKWRMRSVKLCKKLAVVRRLNLHFLTLFNSLSFKHNHRLQSKYNLKAHFRLNLISQCLNLSQLNTPFLFNIPNQSNQPNRLHLIQSKIYLLRSKKKSKVFTKKSKLTSVSLKIGKTNSLIQAMHLGIIEQQIERK